MTFFKKLIFLFSLIAVQLSVKIEAQIAGCGGTYTNLSGTISSPNYPSNYSNNLNCYYYIQISPANSVNITFISFDTEPYFDWLQVICVSDSAKTVPKIDGTNTPPFLSINPCSRVQLLFYTDSSVVRQGFSLRYDIGNGLQGGLTTKPVNAYFSNNSTEPIVLSCSSRANQPGAYPWWSFSTDGYWFRIITAQNCSVFSTPYGSNPVHFNTSRQYSTRTCNLTLLPDYLTSAVGIYTCTDATLDIGSALVAYLTTSFTGSLLSSATTEVVQNDQFTFRCSAQVVPETSYYLQIIPSLYIYSVEDQRLIFSSNTTASIIVSAPPESLPSYACDINYTRAGYFPTGYATNMPEKTSLVAPSRQVLYWPENTRMSIEGDDNGRVVANGSLSCFVPSNPPVTYQWTNEETRLLRRGPTVAVSNNGTYTCIATNIIRGIPYEASKSIDITVIDDQQTLPYTERTEPEDKLNSVALIVGVVLGAAVLLLLILTIVAFACLCRKRSSVRNHSYQNNNPVTTSDKNLQGSQNPQNDHRYELTSRGTLHSDQRIVGTSSAKHDSNFYDNITDHIYDSEIYTEGRSQP